MQDLMAKAFSKSVPMTAAIPLMSHNDTSVFKRDASNLNTLLLKGVIGLCSLTCALGAWGLATVITLNGKTAAIETKIDAVQANFMPRQEIEAKLAAVEAVQEQQRSDRLRVEGEMLELRSKVSQVEISVARLTK